jgi:hypothetical protein
MFPSATGNAFRNFKRQMAEFYDLEVSHEDYCQMCSMVLDLSNPWNCKLLEQDSAVSVYAVRWQYNGDDFFVAVTRTRDNGSKHITGVLPREYLLEHFFDTLIFMTTYARKALSDSKKDADEKCGFEHLSYPQWIDLNKKIMRGEYTHLYWDKETADHKLFLVYGVGGREFPVIWDESISLIIGFEHRDYTVVEGLAA